MITRFHLGALFCALSASAAGACHRAVELPAPSQDISAFVKIEPPAFTTIAPPVRVFGHLSFAPSASYSVRAPLSGSVRSVPVTVGDEVEKGTPLATIESRDAALARSELAKAAVELAAAKSNLTRVEAVFAVKAASERELSEAQSKLAQERAEYARASEAVAALGLEKGGGAAIYVLRASGRGRVIRRGLEPGERVGPDDLKEAFLIGDTSRLVIEATVRERDVSGIVAHAHATFTIAPSPETPFPAHVDYVSNVVDPASRTVAVRLAVEAEDVRLRVDTTATIEISRTSAGNWTVPLTALFLHHDEFVVVVREGGQYVRRKVVPGEAGGRRVAILSGLRKEDQIVTEGALLIDAELDRVLDP